MGHADFELALKMAVENHYHQRDKVGDPYILHVLRVWQRVHIDGLDYEYQIVALLHDIVEDTTVTLEQIKYVFGAKIGAAVDAMTKRKGEARADYIARVKANRIARIVKMADSDDNLARAFNIVDDDERNRLQEKYKSNLRELT